MVRYFQNLANVLRSSHHDLMITAVTSLSALSCLYIDLDSSLWLQNLLGMCAWSVLLFFLFFETRSVQAQVLVAVLFATVGEYFSSVYMEGYAYRLSNVPAFVPPGHGLVYLTAVALGRSTLFERYRSSLLYFAVLSGLLWTFWGLLFAEQRDMYGALLFTVFLLAVGFGRSTQVYLGAYFITSYLEWVGTLLGTWQWSPIDPIFGLTQGNPPSGVAAWYCMVDAVALTLAPRLITLLSTLSRLRLFARLLMLEQKLLLCISPLVYGLLRIKKLQETGKTA